MSIRCHCGAPCHEVSNNEYVSLLLYSRRDHTYKTFVQPQTKEMLKVNSPNDVNTPGRQFNRARDLVTSYLLLHLYQAYPPPATTRMFGILKTNSNIFCIFKLYNDYVDTISQRW